MESRRRGYAKQMPGFSLKWHEQLGYDVSVPNRAKRRTDASWSRKTGAR